MLNSFAVRRTRSQFICDRMGAKFEDCVDIVDERLGKDAAYTLNSAKLRRQAARCASPCAGARVRPGRRIP